MVVREGKGSREHTAVEMGLLGELVVRVAVGVDRAVQLLEGHQGCDEFVVGVQQAAEPLL